MESSVEIKSLVNKFVVTGDHQNSDYFSLIKELVCRRNLFAEKDEEYSVWQNEIDRTYDLVQAELISNKSQPVSLVKFGTSGWRGIIGKDLFIRSVGQVASAIVAMYREIDTDEPLREALGVENIA
ncbi:MAG: phosphoglucomutase, partial [Proteobacteria bacterium]|nr:phosphoglucomutase [Pseudomonadota bacterium]